MILSIYDIEYDFPGQELLDNKPIIEFPFPSLPNIERIPVAFTNGYRFGTTGKGREDPAAWSGYSFDLYIGHPASSGLGRGNGF